jgi:hypothetical protein
MRIGSVLVIALFALVFVGCEDATTTGGSASSDCVAGTADPCYCFEGGTGVKYCKADGTGYGVCQRTQMPAAVAPQMECTPSDEFAYKSCFGNDVFYFDNCDSKTTFVEQCLAEQSCLDGNCVNACQEDYATVCRGSEVVSQDSCGNDREVLRVCGSGSECVDGNCLEACVDSSCADGTTMECACADSSTGTQTCSGNTWGACTCTSTTPDADVTGCEPTTTQAEKACNGAAVVWLDDCGDPGDQVEICANGCTNGVCDTDDECSPANFEKGCHQSEVWWFDYCGNPSSPIEGCPDGYCSEGECVEACSPKAEKQCVNGDVFWFDSCGKQESIAEDCAPAEFCVNLSCVKGSYNGDWWIEPKTPTPGFLGGKWTLTVEDDTGVVTMIDTTAPASVGDVVYTGTLDGKSLEANASYSYDLGGGFVYDIESTVFLNFSADADSIGIPPPTHCDGTLQDSSITQVTGYKM